MTSSLSYFGNNPQYEEQYLRWFHNGAPYIPGIYRSTLPSGFFVCAYQVSLRFASAPMALSKSPSVYNFLQHTDVHDSAFQDASAPQSRPTAFATASGLHTLTIGLLRQAAPLGPIVAVLTALRKAKFGSRRPGHILQSCSGSTNSSFPGAGA